MELCYWSKHAHGKGLCTNKLIHLNEKRSTIPWGAKARLIYAPWKLAFHHSYGYIQFNGPKAHKHMQSPGAYDKLKQVESQYY